MQAALAQSQVNMELATVTNVRQSQLTRDGWASQQAGDQARLSYASVAAVGVARANLQAQQAQVDQLEQLTGFERVVAPFDGVITTRQIDVGSLVTAYANSATRTVLAEANVDNQDGTLAPGMYTVVRLDEPRSDPVISVPSQAVIFDKDGLQAAVEENGVARIRHLDVAADNGATVDVRSGLQAGDRLILNPPIGVVDGMHVRTPSPLQQTASALY